jgi:hypothetical protein
MDRLSYKPSKSPEQLKLLKVYFFWVCRDQRCFEWFAERVKQLEKQSERP